MEFLYRGPSDTSRFYMRSWANVRRLQRASPLRQIKVVRSKSIWLPGEMHYRTEQPMLDVILLAGGIGFFILSIAYAYGCDRL